MVEATTASLALACNRTVPSPASITPRFSTVPRTSSALIVAWRSPASSKATSMADPAKRLTVPLRDRICPSLRTSRPIKAMFNPSSCPRLMTDPPPEEESVKLPSVFSPIAWVVAKRLPTSTRAVGPKTIPLGFEKNTFPLADRAPSICEGLSDRMELSAIDASFGCRYSTDLPSPTLKLFQSRWSVGSACWMTKRLPSWLMLATPLWIDASSGRSCAWASVTNAVEFNR